jgi:hypothetical protein
MVHVDGSRLSVCPTRSSFVAASRAGVDPGHSRRYVAAVRARGFIRCSPGKELNVAQHARRQAAWKAVSAPRFLTLSKVTAGISGNER